MPGKRYILVMVDDYSSNNLVEFLKFKKDAPDAIVNFVKKIQNLLALRVIKIRSNNGTEFKNTILDSF